MTRPRLTGVEVEDALRQFFDAEQWPEIAMVPLTLLAELARATPREEADEMARRVRDRKEAGSTPGP